MRTQPLGPGFVVMTVFRPVPELLRRQIASLQAQTVTDWRCLVGIDGADPKTRCLLQALTRDDDRFEVREYADNAGVYRHVERLLEAVDPGVDWVSLADQDDYWYPEKFERLLPVLARPGVTAVSGQARVVERDGTLLGVTQRRESTAPQLLLRNQLTGSLTLLRRDLLEDALPFPAPTRIAIHDHWLGLCAAALGRIRIVDDQVQDYVQHEANVLGEARGARLGFTSGSRSGHGVPLLSDVRERWGWRVTMASRALSLPLRPRDRTVMTAIQRGRPTMDVLRLVGASVADRRLSALDGAALAGAALAWPMFGGRRDDGHGRA